MMFTFLLCCIFIFVIPAFYFLSFSKTDKLSEILRSDYSPIFETIDRDSGLSNLSVSSIFQDKYGFLWFGTQGGLNRYNGRDMEVIANKPFESGGLVHNLIQTMHYDRVNHEIWIGTYQGVSQYDIANQKFTNYTVEENGLSNPVAIAITKDANGMVWIGTLNGLNKLNPKTGEIKEYSIPGSVVRELKIDSTGRLLIGCHEGLLFYDQKSDAIVKMDIQLPAPIVMCIEEYEQGVLTIGLWDGGIVQYNVKANTLQNHLNFEDNRIYKIIKTSDGTLWAGTQGSGLFAYTTDGKINHFSSDNGNNSLSHPVIYSLYQDQSDILWIGTNGGGVSKVNPRKVNLVTIAHDSYDPKSLSQGKINRILQDQNGDMWFAIYNNGLNKYNLKDKSITKYTYDAENPNSLPGNQVMDMILDGKNHILMGTEVGIVSYDLKKNEFHRWDVLSGNVIYSLEKTSDKEYWIGTYDQGLYYFDLNKGLQKNFSLDNENLLSDNLVYDIFYDSKKRLWVGTNNGLNKMEPGDDQFTIYHKVPGDYSQLSSNTIRVIYEDSSGRIWFGLVGGGIALYNENDTFTSFTEQNGMPDNVVKGILEGTDGKIWASTANGLAILNPENREISALTPDDGIGGWEFDIGHIRDTEGNLYFGGLHGITVIPNQMAVILPYQPELYITSVELYQKPIDKNRVHFNNADLSFGPNAKFLGFRFVALDYDSPLKVLYYYKLEGFDKERISAGTHNYASYSNLPPGKYKLAVWAETSRQVQVGPVYVNFSIAPPWYNTLPAYFAYLILFALVVLGILKIREGQLVNKQNSILEIVNKKLGKANSQLEKLSTRDPLTGVYNRRYFNTVADERLQLAKRSNAYLSFLMFDIDHFKLVNDRFGHLVGDKLLAEMSSGIKQILVRKTDFLARLGGDEFVVVLYDTDKAGAEIVAMQIKQAIDSMHISKNLLSGHRVTISIGITSVIPDKETTLESILKTVDNALYCAKKNGRNTTCFKDILD